MSSAGVAMKLDGTPASLLSCLRARSRASRSGLKTTGPLGTFVAKARGSDAGLEERGPRRRPASDRGLRVRLGSVTAGGADCGTGAV